VVVVVVVRRGLLREPYSGHGVEWGYAGIVDGLTDNGEKRGDN
jgi:hypothetical protein